MSTIRADQGLRRTAAPEAEFDVFATSYQDHLNYSVRISGDTAEYFAAYKAEYIARRLAPGSGTILDYGCGVGLLAGQLKRRLPQMRIDGFDVSQDCLGQINGELAKQGTFSADLGATGKAYDIIVLSNVLHHVKPAERGKLIGEIRSRLTPGGKLVIFEHNPINPLTRWAVAQCVFDQDAILLGAREMGRTLRAAGLRPVIHDYVVFFPRYFAWFRSLEPYLRWCPLGAQSAVIAERG